jgi:uncharacterized delta-60 repeat protein
VVSGADLSSGGGDFAVLRLTPQGTLDTPFGDGNGWKLIDLGGDDDVADAVAVEPGGKIVLAGFSDYPPSFDFVVVRLVSPAGTLDPSFNGSGRTFVNFAGTSKDFGHAVALQPDGRIVASGETDKNGDSDFAVTRLLASGGRDNSFGIMATSVGGFTAASADVAQATALQPDGRIVSAGYSLSGGRYRFAVDRITVPDGNFDNSFGTAGTAIADFGGQSTAHGVALQPDGKIVVAGNADVNSTGANDMAITRLLPNGDVDGSFGIGGRVLIDVGSYDSAQDVAVQPDGKIVLAGFFRSGPPNADFGVVRLNPDGTLDNSFGSGGKASVDFGSVDIGEALAIQPDGKIVVAGATAVSGKAVIGVARLQGDSVQGGGGGGGGAAGGGGTAVLKGLAAHPRAFPAAVRGASVARRKRKTGTTVSYTDTLAATTRFTVLKPVRGVRDKRGRCVKPRKPLRGKRCTRYVSVGGFKHADVAGRNSFHFTGRVRGRKLRPGRYRLRAVPSVGGTRGKAVTATFRIVK